MAWDNTLGAVQIVIPIPPDFNVETAETGVYNTGLTRRGTFFDAMMFEKWDDAELVSCVTIAPPGDHIPSEGQYHHKDLPSAYRRADGCRVIHFWDLSDAEKRKNKYTHIEQEYSYNG